MRNWAIALGAATLLNAACGSEYSTAPTTEPPSASVPISPTTPLLPATTSTPEPSAGVSLRELLERYESRFLEESAGFYRSFRLEPCYAQAPHDSVDDRTPTPASLDQQSPIGYGTVVECYLKTDPQGDSGEFWVIVLDDKGTTTTWSGGTGDEEGLISAAP